MLVAAWRPFPPLVMLCALLLAGCATANLSLSPDEMRTIRIERVDVIFVENAHIRWEKMEALYIERVKAVKAKPRKDEADYNEYQNIMSTSEAKQYLQNALAVELKKRLGAAILPKFQGTRRTVLEVKVHSMVVPSQLQRAVIGGAPALAAVTVLKDSSTGQELAKLDQTTIASAPSGVLGLMADEALERPELEERLFKKYLDHVSSWLLTNRGG